MEFLNGNYNKLVSLVDQLESIEKELKSFNPDKNAASVIKMHEIKEQLIELLSEAIKSYDDETRRGAAYGLSKIHDPAVIPALTEAMKDNDDMVRSWAVEGLGATKDKTVIPLLVKAMCDDSAYVYYSACTSLKKFDPNDLWDVLKRELMTARPLAKKRIIKLLGELREVRALDFIIDMALDEDAHIRYECVEALRKIGDKKSVEILLKCLDDESKDVKTCSIQALRWMMDERVLAALVRVCIENEDLRPMAIQAIVDISGEDVLPVITSALEETKKIVDRTSEAVMSRFISHQKLEVS